MGETKQRFNYLRSSALACLATAAISAFAPKEAHAPPIASEKGPCAAFLIDRYGADSPDDPVRVQKGQTEKGKTVFFTYPSKDIKGLCQETSDGVIGTEAHCASPNDLRITERVADNFAALRDNDTNVEQARPAEYATVQNCMRALSKVLGISGNTR